MSDQFAPGPPLERRLGHGVELACQVYGPPSGETVLLLHGGGQTRHAWGTASAALAATGRCAVAIDLRGHGDSDWAAGNEYEIGDFAADVRSLCLGLPAAPVVVGASLGGLAALVAIGESSDKIARALVLVDVAPKLEAAGVQRILGFMRQGTGGFARVDDAADAVAGYLPHRQRPQDSRGLLNNLRRRPDGRWYWHWDPAFLEARLAAEGRMSSVDYPRLNAAARRIRIPTLMVRGVSSDVISEASVRDLRQIIPHAKTVDVVGAGHMVAGDRNDAFNRVIIEFINQLGPAL